MTKDLLHINYSILQKQISQYEHPATGAHWDSEGLVFIIKCFHQLKRLSRWHFYLSECDLRDSLFISYFL